MANGVTKLKTYSSPGFRCLRYICERYFPKARLKRYNHAGVQAWTSFNLSHKGTGGARWDEHVDNDSLRCPLNAVDIHGREIVNDLSVGILEEVVHTA